MSDFRQEQIDALLILKIRFYIALSDKPNKTEQEQDLIESLSFDPDVANWAAEHPEAFIHD